MRNWKLIEENYDTTKTVVENLDLLNAKGIKVGRTSLYNYAKFNGYITDYVEDILSMYDVSVSLRKNLEILKANGIKCSLGKLSKIYNQYIKDNKEEKIEESTQHFIIGTNKMNTEVKNIETPSEKAETLENRVDYGDYMPDFTDWKPFSSFNIDIDVKADDKPVEVNYKLDWGYKDIFAYN